MEGLSPGLALHLPATGFAEGLEDLHRVGVLRRLPFRVPLHREEEGGEARCMDGFHQAVFGMGDGFDALAQGLQARGC